MNTANKDLVAETKEKSFERSQRRVRQMEVQGFAEFSTHNKKRESEDRFNLSLSLGEFC